MVYAGRLDPMAEGVTLLLTGEDRHQLPDALRHDKTYVARFLFGVASDTNDALGRLRWGEGRAPGLGESAAAVAGLVGERNLRLPVWSAYKVRGRPLHAWAAAGRLDEITVPERAMVVQRVEEVSSRSLSAGPVAELAADRIAEVRGSFRQAEVLADWRRLAEAAPPLLEVVATLTVSSGTYIRALAQHMGEVLGSGCLLFALRRTRVGPFSLDEPARGSAHDLRGVNRDDCEEQPDTTNGDHPLRGRGLLDPEV